MIRYDELQRINDNSTVTVNVTRAVFAKNCTQNFRNKYAKIFQTKTSSRTLT